jgi:hypothetical protein
VITHVTLSKIFWEKVDELREKINTYLYVFVFMSKVKLTVTVNKDTLDNAKKVAQQKRIPLSRLVENFLDFFAEPKVYCFKCGERFKATEAELCPKCGWLQCPKCGVCRCGLSEETAIAVFHMRRVYENLLTGRVKTS